MKRRLPVYFESPDDPLFLAGICRNVRLDHLVIWDGIPRDLNPFREFLAVKLERSQFPLAISECILLIELLSQYLLMPGAKHLDRAARLQKALRECIDPVVQVDDRRQ